MIARPCEHRLKPRCTRSRSIAPAHTDYPFMRAGREAGRVSDVVIGFLISAGLEVTWAVRLPWQNAHYCTGGHQGPLVVRLESRTAPSLSRSLATKALQFVFDSSSPSPSPSCPLDPILGHGIRAETARPIGRRARTALPGRGFRSVLNHFSSRGRRVTSDYNASIRCMPSCPRRGAAHPQGPIVGKSPGGGSYLLTTGHHYVMMSV